VAKLTKQLGLLEVFAVAAGAMISSGLFVLPAIAYAQAGPAVILSYLLAAVLMLPTVFSKAELATAMPRAGGTYFYVERSLGSIWGLFSGLANWFSLALKSAFAIVGLAVFVELFAESVFAVKLSPVHLKGIAVCCCLCFTALNVVSVKQTGRFQVLLVAMLLAILVLFVFFGCGGIDPLRYKGFLRRGWSAVFATSGLVFISFGGLTKIASVAEEVKNPAKNLALGMILAWAVVTLFYIAVIGVTVGLVKGSELTKSYAPISLAASRFWGPAGFVILGFAAIAAFITTANGGIMAASRCPMAMSNDQLLPSGLSRLSNRFKTPHVSVVLTGVFMIVAVVLLEIEQLVKTASTLMIILFILDNASVIIMRESRIQSYRPKFQSPLYPYIHIAAIIAYSMLIVDMGKVPLLITAGFVGISSAWYVFYSSKRVRRASAVMHIVERVTDRELKTDTLENELRDILMERDNIVEDRFDKLIRNCKILDIKGRTSAKQVFRKISTILAERLDTDEYVLFEKFLHREARGGTVVQPGLAIPHIVVEGEEKFDILPVRAADGIDFPHSQDIVKIMFVLVGSKDERNYHLRALMAIAQIAQEQQFEQRWFAARGADGIRNLMLLSARKRDTK